jgi:hypothetical protein
MATFLSNNNVFFVAYPFFSDRCHLMIRILCELPSVFFDDWLALCRPHDVKTLRESLL